MIGLWVEGYAATGESNGAQYLGSWPGNNYEEAVLAWKKAKWSESHWGSFKQRADGQYAIWGCRIFDNHADAKKGFG